MWHPINNPAELGRIQDQLVETLDRPEITDKLRGLALELAEVAQQLHPVTYNRDGIVSADEQYPASWKYKIHLAL